MPRNRRRPKALLPQCRLTAPTPRLTMLQMCYSEYRALSPRSVERLSHEGALSQRMVCGATRTHRSLRPGFNAQKKQMRPILDVAGLRRLSGQGVCGRSEEGQERGRPKSDANALSCVRWREM